MTADRSAASRWGPVPALVRRALLDARARTLSFAAVFALYAYVQPFGYRRAYPSLAERVAFARSFADNLGLRLLYGDPRDVASVNGYTAWRVGGTLAIAAAFFGLLAAVRALRAEEDAGRAELVLAGVVGRRAAVLAALGAGGAGIALLGAAELAGLLGAGLPLAGSVLLALATATVAAVGLGVGALASQLASTHRGALAAGGAAVTTLFLLRVVADTTSGAEWLRWTTPLGWAEEVRPFTGARPLVLALPMLATALLLAVSVRVALRRDLGTGLLPARDSAEPRLRLLSSPAAHAFRTGRGVLVAWLVCVAAFGYVLGIVANGVSSVDISSDLEEQLAKLGAGSISTPGGYLSFVFVFFTLALALAVCAQVGAARQEEAEQRLETLLALPVGRVRWLTARLLLAVLAAAAIALAAGLATWAGAASAGAGIPLRHTLEAAANTLPIAILFLGLAALAYAISPRASTGVGYGLVAVAFLWHLVGSLLSSSDRLLGVTPFAHVAAVPAQPFRATAAVVMVAIGAVAALAATAVFRRRDLAGA